MLDFGAVPIVYLDESAQPATEVFTVAGYAFSPENAALFEVRWAAALGDARIRRFHMSEFEARRGEFADGADDRRRELLVALFEVIQTTAEFEVSATLDLAAWEQISGADRALLADPTPYSLCVQEVLAHVTLWRYRQGTGQTVSYVLDQLGANQGKSYLWDSMLVLNKDPVQRADFRISDWRWADSTLTPQIQAADVLAYEAAKEGAFSFGRSTRGPRRSLVELLKRTEKIAKRHVLIDEQKLSDYVRRGRTMNYWVGGDPYVKTLR